MEKGFTLIELLAVIVILSIISLIAVPIVINIINDSKYESQKRSIDYYAKALEQAVADYQLKNNKKVEGRFNTTDGKTLTREDTTLNVDYKGNVVCNRIVVNKDGSIYLSECTVDDDKVYISKSESNKEKPKYYEYGKTEYGMIMENKSHSSNFLNTGIPRSKIYQFSISNILNIENKETYESVDCSYNQDESVICYWKEVDNKPGYYNMILASDGEMYTPYDSSYLFRSLLYAQWKSDNIILDVSKINTKYTTNMSYMFSYSRPNKIVLGDKFDTSKVTDMSHMFESSYISYYGEIKLPSCFDTSNVKDMSYMFHDTEFITSLDLGDKFDTSKVTDMSFMLSDMFRLTNLDLGDKFDTSNVTNMKAMFYRTGDDMEELNLGDKFDTSNVTNMEAMFRDFGKNKLEYLDLGDKFDTSSVIYMNNMFGDLGRQKLKTLDLGDKFDTSSVIYMNNMFEGTGYDNMETLNLGNNFDTSNVTNMGSMFRYCGSKKLKKLDLGKLFIGPQGRYADVSRIFEGTGKESLEELYLWNFDYLRAYYYGRSNIFKDCGTEGILTKVVVSSDSIKTKIEQLTSPNDIPQFWKDNNIIEVQTN